MGFVSDKQGYRSAANQAQLEISHPAWAVIRLKAKDSSQGVFLLCEVRIFCSQLISK